MNTVKKGNKLEEIIHDLFREEIANDNFFVKADYCKIFKQKGYYSKDREKDIVFDLSIEVFLPNQNTYSLLILIECKNYNHSVPVDDVEEFYQKIQQISGANTKGVVASTGSFQEGTLKFSKSKGIGLFRYFDRTHFKWVLTRPHSAISISKHETENKYEIQKGITNQSFKSNYFDFFCVAEDDFTNSVNSFFASLIWSISDKKQNKNIAKVLNYFSSNKGIVVYKEKDQIEALCKSIRENIGYKTGSVSLNKICEMQKESNGLRVNYIKDEIKDSEGIEILGSISFNPHSIKIYSESQALKHRERFTLAHELGHLFLGHSEYMQGEYCQESDLDLESSASLKIHDICRLEWQANYFASCLLLPKEQFISDFLCLLQDYGINNRGFGSLYVDSQKCNLDSYYTITNYLKGKFNVSRSVIKIKLENAGLLNFDEDTTEKIFKLN